MIVFQENKTVTLRDFGIQIPLEYERSDQILSYLRRAMPSNGLWEKYLKSEMVETISKERLLSVHDSSFVERLHGEGARQEIIKCYELTNEDGTWNRFVPEQATRPLEELVIAQLKEAQLTLDASQIALDKGFCYHLGGGQHHAMPDIGRGFCLVNDIVIAADHALRSGRVSQVVVIDIDAHKGDGTAVMTSGREDIVSMSIHMAQGWPLDDHPGKDLRAEIASDLDVGVQSSSDYLAQLENGLRVLKEKLDAPGLAIIVDGSDPSERDTLPSTSHLSLSDSEMLIRDQMVYEFCEALNLPQLWVMAGGYGPEVYKIHGQFLSWWLEHRAAS